MRTFSEQTRPDHFLCRTDARVKLLSTLAILVMVLSYRGILLPLVVCAVGTGLCASMGVRFKTLLFRFSEPFFIILIILVLKTFFSGKQPLFSLFLFGLPVTAHVDGLMEGVLIGCRIIGGVTAVAVLGFSTPFNQFMGGLSWMKVPRGFVEVSMFAYRYIFMLFDDAAVIYNAQKNRLGYSTIGRGLGSFGILAGSLVLKAFESSQNTAVAMAQRGYDGNMPTLEHRPFRPREVALSALFIVAMGILWRI
jgi:cobalt/nickel transport system permease protein